MSDDASREVTEILRDLGERPDAAEALLPLVYAQLRAIAQKRMAGERAGHTLEATALVHEAYMRLLGNQEIDWQSRGHFYGAAAEAMRRILIDHARKKGSQKRGGGRQPIAMNVVDLASEQDPGDILALDEAITTLAGEDHRAAEVVRLRFYAGLSVEETAAALGVSERTVMREWSYARARLYQLLADDNAPEPGA
ncbi:MAG: ECF-type sigma factor [Phycisphaerales bacterium]